MSKTNLQPIAGESGDPGKVKRKANKTGKIRVDSSSAKARVARMTAGTPEVVVKISSFGKGGEHAKAHLAYISRNAKLEMENERGEIFKDKDAIRDLHKDWMADIDQHRKSPTSRDTMHVILSMRCDMSDADKVKDAAREFAKQTFSNHEYVFVLHKDTDNPHVHLSVKMRGFNGRKLHVGMGDPQLWREHFAENLRKRGIDAEATSRFERGVTKKSEKQVIRHINNSVRRGVERVARVTAGRVNEVVKELELESMGMAVVPKVWDEKIAKAQREVRSKWLQIARELRKSEWKIKTNDGKVLSNERPDYAALRAAKNNRNAANLFQSSIGNDRGRTPAQSNPSVRNMPSSYVDRARKGIALLLPAHARIHMGGRLTTDSEMRRSRDSLNADGQREGERVTNTQLGNRIRGFVAKMPKVQTAHQALKERMLSVGRAALDTGKLKAVMQQAIQGGNDAKKIER